MATWRTHTKKTQNDTAQPELFCFPAAPFVNP
jgi:hypothetical protein